MINYKTHGHIRQAFEKLENNSGRKHERAVRTDRQTQIEINFKHLEQRLDRPQKPVSSVR